ncbi:hypothetical protein [Streptomyces sp. NPDC050287]|uniref:hypothetical protein n=1 Tax=Streptomyces sp. NPDC050287 TaxID=3365608 RepID=UPI003789C973
MYLKPPWGEKTAAGDATPMAPPTSRLALSAPEAMLRSFGRIVPLTRFALGADDRPMPIP